MNGLFLLLALFSELAAVVSLRCSQGFAQRLPKLSLVVFSILSLTLLSLALPRGSASGEVDVVYTIWAGVGIACIATLQLLWKQREQWTGKEIGPIGTIARLGLGLVFVGSVVHGQLATHLALGAWALGLIGFSALMLVWHWWRIHRNPVPFRDTSPLSFVLSIALPLALYFTWWYAPTLAMTSDAVLIFVGTSMVLAALRSYAGCELLALSNWLLHRTDQMACAVFTPIDSLEQRGSRL